MADIQDVLVLGAGIIGVSTAIHLARRGRSVVLVDRRGVGEETSFGNAGFLSLDSLIPLARPSTLKSLPRMLTDRTGPLTLHTPSLPWLIINTSQLRRAEYWRLIRHSKSFHQKTD